MDKFTDVVGFGGGGGGKGGGGGSAPEDQPDTATSKSIVKVLDLISEGPIKGLVTGDARSIYTDGTPVQAENGEFNIPGVGWEIRHGTQDQTHIPGFPSVENEVSLRQELRSDNPFTREFTNPDLSFVRIRMQLPSLQKITDNGIKGYRIDYQLELSSAGGPFEIYRGGAFDDKSSGVYERDETIQLPANKAPWRVRVRRLTENANDTKISDTVYVVAVVEGIDAKLRYPNSALVGLQVDADQFTSVPTRGYLVDGLICRVPSNYEPETRTYSGIWDGTFKQAYTNNPIWVLYTIAGHPRFGLRDRINYGNFNIWSLYEVAKFCDEPVPDGKGGTEPRYTVNTYIQTRQQGYEFLANMASVFKGMAYMVAGNIGISADMPRPPGSRVYTNSDVENGEFMYAGSEAGTRYTSAAVGWNNPANLYQKEVVYEEVDATTIAQLGLVQTEFDAFACTSEGQARRSARWALLTSQYETDVITFVASLNALRDKVGDVIQVQDTNRSLMPNTEGRIASATVSEVVLDRAVDPSVVGSSLIVSMPSGYSESNKIVAVSGRTVTVSPPYTGVPQVQGVWAIDGEVRPALYRIRTITDEGDSRFKVTAYAYAEGKHGNIESGVRIEERPTINPGALQTAPTNLRVTGGWIIDQGVSVPNVTFAWDQTKNADTYEGAWRADSGEWIRFARQGNTELTIDNIRTGNYQFWVRAIGPTGAKSKMVYSNLVEVKGKDTPPPVVASLTTESQVMAIKINIGYPSVPDNTEYAEIWSSPNASFSSATYLTQIAYPGDSYTLQNLAHDTRVWFWVRLVDKNKLAGDFYPATTAPGVVGQTEADANNILSYLTEKISKEQLTQDLLAPIESIVDIQAEMDGVQQAIAGLTTANQNLDQALQDTNDRVDALQQKVDDLSLGEQYDPAKAYLAGTVVFDNGKMYQALQDVPAGTPTSNTTYWKYVGDYASLEAAISAVSLGLSTLEVRVTEVDGKVDANASQIEALQSKVDDPNSGLTALAQGMQQLQTQVTTLDGTITTVVSNLTALTARVDATEQGLSAQGSAIQDLNTTVTQHGNDISSNSNSITQLTASVGSAQQSADAAQQAAQDAMTAAGSKGEVIYGTSTPGTAKRLPQNLWIDTTGGKNTPKRWNGTAWVEVTDKVAKDAAAAAAAAQQTANEAKTIAEGAATAVQGLTATVNQHGNDITANSQAVTRLGAKITSIRDSDSLLPDYMMGNPDDWYSFYATQPTLAPYFTQVTDGKVSTSVFRWTTTDRNFNFSRTTLPIVGTYRLRAWVRRSTDSDGSIRFTAKYRKTNDSDSGVNTNYTSHTVTEQVPADGQWHEVNYVWTAHQQYLDQGFTGVRFGFSVNYVNTAGWAEIQGMRVTRVIGGADVDPTQVATADAVQTIAATVEQQGNTIVSQGSSITQLTNRVGANETATQNAQQTADEAKTAAQGASSAVQALTSTVTEHSGQISSNAQSLTALEATVTNLNSAASNLLVDSNTPITRAAATYHFGTYLLSENFIVGEKYTLVVNYTHNPAAGDTSSAIGVWAGGSSQKVGELEKGKVAHTQVIRFTKSTNVQNPKDLRFYYVPSPGSQDGGATIHWATLYLGDTLPILRWQPNLNETAGGAAATAQAVQRLTVDVDDVKASAANIWAINAQMRDMDDDGESLLRNALKTAGLAKQLVETSASVSQVANAVTTQEVASADLTLGVQASITAANSAVAGATAANETAVVASAAAQMALQAVVDVEGRISTSWQVKLEAGYQGNLVVSGLQLGISNESGQLQSSFIVMANRFAIVDNISGEPRAVFVTQNGQSILSSAIIGDGTINRAKIAYAAIGSAEIEDGAITRAKIAYAAISSAEIADGAILRAKIGAAEIDTLRLAGNSVTLHASRSGSGSLTVSTPYGGIANIMVFYNGSASTSTLKHNKVVIRVNGWVLAQFPALHIYSNNSYLPNIENPISKVASVELGAGNNTIDVWATDVSWRPGIDPTPPPMLYDVETIVLFNMR